MLKISLLIYADMGYTNRTDMLPCVYGEGGNGYSVDSLSRSISNLLGTYKVCQANRLSTGTGTQCNLRYVDISGGYFLGSGCSLQVGAAGQLGWEASLLRLLPGRAHNFVWAYGTGQRIYTIMVINSCSVHWTDASNCDQSSTTSTQLLPPCR